MAKKRMFNNKVLDSDAFLDMPLSAQALYFHLNLRADDDGFISNPNRVRSYVGASEDDLKILLMKRFVIAFDDGVIVIKHWRMHNTIQKDRYTPTDYQEDLAMLGIKENKAYTLENENGNKMFPKCIQNVSTDIDIDKGIDIDIDKGIDKTLSNDNVCRTEVQQVIEKWNELSGFGIQPIVKISDTSNRHKMLKARIREYGLEDVFKAIDNIKTSNFLQGKSSKGWQITFDWFVKPNNFPKVLEGNYNTKRTTDDMDWSIL